MEEAKQKILIVDDSNMIIKVLTEMLQDEYTVIAATSGEEALQIALREIPDLILLDVVLKNMDGYKVCEIIKKDVLTKNIPIIFITGLNDDNDEKKGLELGAIDYITKPFSEPIVKIRIKNHLELKSHRDFLEKISSLDGLTSIYNRRYFDMYYDKEWNRAIRERRPISLIMLDIDRFKYYNDNYGHLAGDECLKKVSKEIERSLLRKNDIVVRLGGEEFACILPDTTLDNAVLITERIFSNIRDLKIKHEYSDISPYVTFSAGVGCITPHEEYKSRDFLYAVDKLLFIAKRRGRNQIISDHVVI